jgi:hypothetical protein
MGFDPAVARKVLAGIRIVNGTAGLLAPEFLLGRLGTDLSRDRSGIYPFRMFGIRTVLIGADLLVLHGEQRRRATKVAILIHASDTMAAAVAGIRGDLPRKSAVMTTLISAGNTVLAVLANRE